MAELLTRIPTNLTEYPNSFKRQGCFPLEAYSVFYTSFEEVDGVKTAVKQTAKAAAEKRAAEEKAKAEERARIAAEKEAAAKVAAEKRAAEEKAKAEELARIAAKKAEQRRIKAEQNKKLFAEPVSGYSSMVNLSYTAKTGHDYFGVDYIGGYRFNNKNF